MLELDADTFDFPTSCAPSAACAYALGQLDGALRTLDAALEPLLAATVAGRALSAALADAGYAEPDSALSRWLPTGTAPLAGPHTVLGPPALAHVVLHQLEQAAWPALADCARVLRRAVPHLTAPNTATAGELTEAWAVLAQAQTALCHDPADDVAATLDRFAEQVRAAGDTPVFARGQADPATFATPWGPRSYYRSPPRPHSWALNLIAGDVLHHVGLLSRAMPLEGSVRIGALRVDLPPGERRTILLQGLTAAARAALRMVETCGRRHAHHSAALAHLRSTSRAPAILAVLAGIGPLTRLQIAQGFAISRQGVDGIVDVLAAAGLVERDRGVVTLASWNSAEAPPARAPEPLVALSSLAEVDAALAALDALLAKSNRSGDPDGG